MKSLVFSFVFLSVLNLFAAANTQITKIEGRDLLVGKDISATAESKKALVVVFLSAVCPCSNSHIKELTDLKNDFSEFEFVGIHSNSDESEEIAKNYFDGANLSFPVIQDKDSVYANKFKALKTPHAFVVLPDGQEVYRGGVSSSREFENADHKYLRDALGDIQNGRKVKVATSRALGCTISRGEKNVL